MIHIKDVHLLFLSPLVWVFLTQAGVRKQSRTNLLISTVTTRLPLQSSSITTSIVESRLLACFLNRVRQRELALTIHRMLLCRYKIRITIQITTLPRAVSAHRMVSNSRTSRLPSNSNNNCSRWLRWLVRRPGSPSIGISHMITTMRVERWWLRLHRCLEQGIGAWMRLPVAINHIIGLRRIPLILAQICKHLI